MSLMTDQEIKVLADLASDVYFVDVTVGEVAASFAQASYDEAVKRGCCHAWAAQSAAVDTMRWLRANGCGDYADAVVVHRTRCDDPVAMVTADMATYARLTICA